jgi:hypothetical protein
LFFHLADLLTLLILQSQLSHSILTFKITNSQRKSTYTGIHHGAIAEVFGLLNFRKSRCSRNKSLSPPLPKCPFCKHLQPVGLEIIRTRETFGSLYQVMATRLVISYVAIWFLQAPTSAVRQVGVVDSAVATFICNTFVYGLVTLSPTASVSRRTPWKSLNERQNSAICLARRLP